RAPRDGFEFRLRARTRRGLGACVLGARPRHLRVHVKAREPCAAVSFDARSVANQRDADSVTTFVYMWLAPPPQCAGYDSTLTTGQGDGRVDPAKSVSGMFRTRSPADRT